MSKPAFDPQVIIPYSTLCDLLNASIELKNLRKEIKRLSDQQARIKGTMLEIMEKIREIE